jgi:hypothetical protein
MAVAFQRVKIVNKCVTAFTRWKARNSDRRKKAQKAQRKRRFDPFRAIDGAPLLPPKQVQSIAARNRCDSMPGSDP